MLCCELAECDTAWFQDKVCYSVACKDNVCETEKATGVNQNSAVLQIKRKSQNDVKGGLFITYDQFLHEFDFYFLKLDIQKNIPHDQACIKT